MDTLQELEKDLLALKKRDKKIKKKLFVGNENKVLKKLKKHLKPLSADTNLKVLPIKYKGKNVLEVSVVDSRYKSKGYSKSKMQKIGDDLSKLLHENGVDGYIWSTLKFDSQYRTGRFSVIGDDVNLYNIDENYGSGDNYSEKGKMVFRDQKYFKRAVFYIGETKLQPAGGADNKFNDCLYMCLYYALLKDNPFKSAKRLKDYLGLKRDALVHIDMIPKIEEKLKYYKINVSGDFIYTSTLTRRHEINLKLVNCHYSLNHSVNRKVVCISYEEKKPIFHDKLNKLFYDGEKEFPSTIEMIEDIKHFRTEYISIPKTDKSKSFKEEYDEFIRIADDLKEITKNKINLYKTGTIKQTALNLFDSLTKTIMTPEHISQDEAVWIQEAAQGAVIFSNEYEGEAYKYDVISMYPSIQIGTTLCLPVKRGEFLNKSLSEFNDFKFYPFGIYRCIIEKSDNEHTNKLFRFNRYNRYTHIDLTTAKSLNLKINLIQDDKPNMLYYSRDKTLSCHEIFNKYVDYLFPLKNSHGKEYPIIKQILNILWGALCQTREIREVKKYDSESVLNIDDDKIISILSPTRDETGVLVYYLENEYIYKSPFARLKPFLLAKGRNIITSIIMPYREDCVRCHTDGFILKSKTDIKTGSKIGELKYEGYSSYIKVKNNAKPEGEEFKL